MTTTDSRLSRLARALAVVVSRPPVAVASTALKLRNPLNGGGLSTSRGARMASNARRQKERAVGRTLARRLSPWDCTYQQLPENEQKRCVVLTRISPRPFDDDNNAAALKSVRDGIAEAWGIDDAEPRVTWVTDWRKGGKDAVEAALWVLPSEWVPMPHADSPTLREPRMKGRERNAPCPCGCGAKFKNCRPRLARERLEADHEAALTEDWMRKRKAAGYDRRSSTRKLQALALVSMAMGDFR